MYNLIQSHIRSCDNVYALSVSDRCGGKKSGDCGSGKSGIGKPVFLGDKSKDGGGGKSVKCNYCKSNDHFMNKCSEFLTLPIQERYEAVLRLRLCRNCLWPGHISGKCKHKALCSKCPAKHNTVLYNGDFKHN